MQANVRKCFDNIHHLRIGDATAAGGATQASSVGSVTGAPVEAMVSAEGEDVPLVRAVKARGLIEEWLAGVEDSMKQTIAVSGAPQRSSCSGRRLQRAVGDAVSRRN